MTSLSRARLALPEAIIAPGYDVRSVTPGIVHIGLGGFHRAHFARYTHDLMEIDPSALIWGIVGSGLRESDAALLAAMRAQDGLYTLVERDTAGETCALIGSITDAIDAFAESADLVAAIVRPETRIVSITVSEHGYNLDSATKSFWRDSPAVQHDLAHPGTPRTMPGVLVEALRQRRADGLGGITALSCDNIQHNGNILRASVLDLAELTDPTLVAWIDDNVCFPNSMVDRITPVATADEIAAFAARTGLADRVPVFAESFRQWVIEDRFAAGRPAWERVGAQFVSDVAPYEAMKLRLLNASHLAIASLGALCGYETIRETIGDPLIRRYMIRLMDAETGPTLPPVPGIDLAQYKSTLLDRFANPAIRDTVKRVNTDAPLNLLLDPWRDRLAEDASIELLSLGLAAWCRRVRNEAEALAATDQRLPTANIAYSALRALGDDPVAMLSVEPLFGAIGRDARLVSKVGYWLKCIADDGIAATLAQAKKRSLL